MRSFATQISAGIKYGVAGIHKTGGDGRPLGDSIMALEKKSDNLDMRVIGGFVVVAIGCFFGWPRLCDLMYSWGMGEPGSKYSESSEHSQSKRYVSATELPKIERRSQLQTLQSEGDRLVEEAQVLQMTAAWIALDGADEGEMREIRRLLNKNTAELEQVNRQIEQLLH